MSGDEQPSGHRGRFEAGDGIGEGGGLNMAIRQGWKIVHPDFTTGRNRATVFTWPFPGREVVADNIDHANRDVCPSREGDGFCLAKTAEAATSGGISLASCVGLIVEFDEADVLAESTEKLRVRRAQVVGVFDPLHLIRLGLAPDLHAANLHAANLHHANLGGADLSGADLRGADLQGANLSDANLQGADLYGANLSRADLYGADLYGANLSRADLRDADLRDANLRRADLSGADLRRADLRDADLRDADLRDADLHGANLPDGHNP